MTMFQRCWITYYLFLSFIYAIVGKFLWSEHCLYSLDRVIVIEDFLVLAWTKNQQSKTNANNVVRLDLNQYKGAEYER